MLVLSSVTSNSEWIKRINPIAAIEEPIMQVLKKGAQKQEIEQFRNEYDAEADHQAHDAASKS